MRLKISLRISLSQCRQCEGWACKYTTPECTFIVMSLRGPGWALAGLPLLLQSGGAAARGGAGCSLRISRGIRNPLASHRRERY